MYLGKIAVRAYCIEFCTPIDEIIFKDNAWMPKTIYLIFTSLSIDFQRFSFLSSLNFSNNFQDNCLIDSQAEIIATIETIGHTIWEGVRI